MSRKVSVSSKEDLVFKENIPCSTPENMWVGQQVQEKMLNITNYQRNANQN